VRRGGQVLGGPAGKDAPVRVGHIQRGEASRQQRTFPPPAGIEVVQEPGTGRDAITAVHARGRRQNVSYGLVAVPVAHIP
jgi:hypothetical protein